MGSYFAAFDDALILLYLPVTNYLIFVDLLSFLADDILLCGICYILYIPTYLGADCGMISWGCSLQSTERDRA